MNYSMILGLFSWLGEKFNSIFKFFQHIFEDIFNFIPKIIYMLNTSFLSIVDLIQLLFRKVAGLDVYYSNGEAMHGDLLTNFISGILGITLPGAQNDTTSYSVLSTVFWSFVVFGIIILFVSTMISLVKAHYSLDSKDVGSPKPTLIAAGKAIINMIAVPVIVVLGLFLSQSILKALDDITITHGSTVIEKYADQDKFLSSEDASGRKTYTFYDIFGYTGSVNYQKDFDTLFNSSSDLPLVAATYQPFSGSMFKVAAHGANRVRTGYYVKSDKSIVAFTGNGGGGLSIFTSAGNDKDAMAELVDTAFANFLHLTSAYKLSYDDGPGWLRAEIIMDTLTAWNIAAFSKFNVGLVWYYYNLWNYNFIVGFGAVIIFLTLLINITLGMMKRFFLCIVMFLIMPGVIGVTPLDGGNGFKNWTKKFIEQVLLGYGAVIGMNLMLLILPYINDISFFNIPVADMFTQTLFMIVGLTAVKETIGIVSGFIGGGDAASEGDKISDSVMSTMGAGVKATLAAPLAMKRGIDMLKKKKKDKNGEEGDGRLKGVGQKAKDAANEGGDSEESAGAQSSPETKGDGRATGAGAQGKGKGGEQSGVAAPPADGKKKSKKTGGQDSSGEKKPSFISRVKSGAGALVKGAAGVIASVAGTVFSATPLGKFDEASGWKESRKKKAEKIKKDKENAEQEAKRISIRDEERAYQKAVQQEDREYQAGIRQEDIERQAHIRELDMKRQRRQRKEDQEREEKNRQEDREYQAHIRELDMRRDNRHRKEDQARQQEAVEQITKAVKKGRKKK